MDVFHDVRSGVVAFSGMPKLQRACNHAFYTSKVQGFYILITIGMPKLYVDKHFVCDL